MSARQIGNYRVIEYIGSGGFGSVFKAEDVNAPGRFVAIKELHRKHTRSAVIKQRFFQEALAMARLDHPNIPRLYTFGEDNGSYYLVMEFVSGSPLSEEIHEKGPIPPGRAVPIMRHVLEAVSYAHKNGVIHRDLKPDNIILVDSGPAIVKVLDFGIAKMVGGENLTLTGEGFGTPSYMSPERIIGKTELDARTDVYSLGIILFEMLAGHVPFQSKSTDPALYWVEMRRKHETEPIPDLAAFGVPPDLEAIIKKATAKTLEERYSTAEEMLAAIRGESATACLVVTSNPSGAEVFLDNISRGITGLEKGRLMIEGLTAGLHAVKVMKRGYSPYKIDVSLSLGQQTELQVQLPAASTTAIPRREITEPVDPNTDRINSGDDAKTAMLMIESLSPGSMVSAAGGGQAVAGADGRAIMALGAGVHEINVVSPSGVAIKQTVTVGNQELGSLKTIALPPSVPTDPAPPVPIRPTASPLPAYSPQSYSSSFPSSVGPTGKAPASTLGKSIAAAVAVVLLLGLTAAAYFVLRGPGRAPATSNTPPTQQVAQNEVLTPPSPTPESTVTPTPMEVATPLSTPDQGSKQNKNSNAKTKLDKAPPTDIPVQETPKPMRPESTPVIAGTPAPVPTPRVNPYPSPRDADEGSEFGGGACVAVRVTGPSGNGVEGLRVVCVDEQAGLSGVRRGMTGVSGGWRACGVTAGHRVLIRVMGPGGRILGARQVQVSQGRNVVSISIPYEPMGANRFPDRKPRFWQRP